MHENITSHSASFLLPTDLLPPVAGFHTDLHYGDLGHASTHDKRWMFLDTRTIAIKTAENSENTVLRRDSGPTLTVL